MHLKVNTSARVGRLREYSKLRSQNLLRHGLTHLPGPIRCCSQIPKRPWTFQFACLKASQIHNMYGSTDQAIPEICYCIFCCTPPAHKTYSYRNMSLHISVCMPPFDTEKPEHVPAHLCLYAISSHRTQIAMSFPASMCVAIRHCTQHIVEDQKTVKWCRSSAGCGWPNVAA